MSKLQKQSAKPKNGSLQKYQRVIPMSFVGNKGCQIK